MNKKFTDNEVRAYSKNRFEERALRVRLERLRDEFLNYNDSSAKRRINIIQESRGLRRTSGGSPVRSLLSEEDWDEEFCVRDRVRRPWAYSVMETTYNSIYREAELPLPKSRNRQRAKSAATVLMTIPSVAEMCPQKGDKRKDRRHLPALPGSSMSASRIDNMPISESIKTPSTNSDNPLVPSSSSLTIPSSVKFVENEEKASKRSDSKHKIISSPDNTTVHVEITTVNNSEEENSMKDKPNVVFKNKDNESRPYAKVMSLPPAYTIDSKSYQDAEWERLRSRSKSRNTFTQSTGVVSIPSPDDKTRARSADKHEKTRDKNPEMKSETNVNTDIPTKEQDPSTGSKDREHSESNEINENEKNVVKAKESVTYRGQLIKNYIRPEDRYKLDPSILNRRQNRMDKLAKESSTYLKRINHENIRVEIAFPRSARKRLLTKLVEENNTGRKKTLSNTDGPFIKKKVERFMVSIGDYIEQQGFQRANTTI